MKKLLFIIGLLLIGGVAYCQNAQVNPVAALDQPNTSVVNNNFQNVQTGLNGIFGLFSRYFTGGYLNTANGGTGKDSSAWTSGDLVYMSGAGIWNHAPISSFNVHGVQIFTSSGTFTCPTGVTKIYLTMIGGGGGGAGSAAVANHGGGGASGKLVIDYPYTVVPGNVYTITIGASGAAGILNGDGAIGGTTIFDAISVLGGNPGLSTSNGCGAACGGAAYSNTSSGTTGGNFGIPMGAGFTGNNPANSGGAGGGSVFGPGGNGGGLALEPTAAAVNTGAGGGGAQSTTSGSTGVGASGGSGILIIKY